jgi:mitochondrial fission protein ELM1
LTSAELPSVPVWVLDDPRAVGAEQILAIADRLGVPYRRLPMSWTWLAMLAPLARRGSLLGLVESGRGAEEPSWLQGNAPVAALTVERSPALVLSAGLRAGSVALWLKERYGCGIVQYERPTLRTGNFDLLVLPKGQRAPAGVPIMTIVGPINRVSPLALYSGEEAWRERLAHLPHPRTALFVGGPARGSEMPPALAHDLGRRVGRLVAAARGSVMAITDRRTGAEATDALAAGLGPAFSVIHRFGDPGEDPSIGYLALADAIIVTSDLVERVGDACVTSAPVFIALPELASTSERKVLRRLLAADHARPLGGDLAAWTRTPLDEAGRVAVALRQRFALE